MKRLVGIAARIVYLTASIFVALAAYNNIRDYVFTPFNEPYVTALFIFILSLPGAFSHKYTWLLPLAAGIAETVLVVTGRPYITLLGIAVLAGILGYILGEWSSGRAKYTIDWGRTARLVIAFTLIIIAFTVFSRTMFTTLYTVVTGYLQGLPADVGEFYDTVTGTTLWRFIAYTVIALLIFKLLEVLIDLITKLSRGGHVLARYDAMATAKLYIDNLILMRRDQYMMLSEGYSIIATILFYPLLYAIITGFFTAIGMNLEGATSLLVLVLLFPSWIIVRAFIKRSSEPEPIQDLLKKKRMTGVLWYIILFILISIGLYMAGVDLKGVYYSMATGDPIYNDPFSQVIGGKEMGEALESLGRAIDEGGRILIKLLWGG